MLRINEHYLNLTAGYLFPEIGRRVAAYQKDHPEAAVIKLGIGDVTEPLPQACIIAMHKAVEDMADRESFRGYGPEQGYEWLREKVAEFDYALRGCDVMPDEVFISDGSKCDTGNMLDILGTHAGENRVAVCDPVYPVYVDTNVMSGNATAPDESGRYGGLIYLPMTAENRFEPPLPGEDEPADVIYLCFPNNPTGAVASRETLKRFVDYARRHGSLILFDAAYEAFITDEEIPHSIYEIDGARECAVEFRSYSKSGGFTGVRCAYTVVPKGLAGRTGGGESVELHRLWSRRQTTKFNGVSYITQRAAEALYSDAGREQVADLVSFYLENARIIREGLAEQDIDAYGGVNAPYVWLRTPESLSSWAFFDKLLEETPHRGVPPAAGSARRAKATSASPPSTQESGSRRRWSGSARSWRSDPRPRMREGKISRIRITDRCNVVFPRATPIITIRISTSCPLRIVPS